MKARNFSFTVIWWEGNILGCHLRNVIVYSIHGKNARCHLLLNHSSLIFGCPITYSYTQKWILCPPPLNSRNFLSFFFNVPFICFVDKHTFNNNMFVIEVSHCYNRLYLYLMLLLATKSFKSVTNCSNGTFFSWSIKMNLQICYNMLYL